MEQSREPTNRNRIQGEVAQGERAQTAKLYRPKSYCVDPAVVRRRSWSLTWGDLASRLKGRRREAEREVSRGRSSQRDTADASTSALTKG